MSAHVDALIAQLCADQHGLVRHDQLVTARLTRNQIGHRLANGLLLRVFDLVYRHPAAPANWESELLAATWAGGPRGAASRRSAAALFGLPGGVREIVEITCPRWRRSRHDRLVVHETNALTITDLSERRGIPCTSVERTLLDLGAERGGQTVLMAFDQAVRQRLTDWHRVDQTLRRLARSGRPGIRKLRRALAQRVENAAPPESPKETALGSALADAGIAAEPQFVITDSRGFFLARVDWAVVAPRIALEYDSNQHHLTPAELERDNARRNRLLRAGWTTVSVRPSDLRDGGQELMTMVRELIQSRFGVTATHQISITDAKIDQAIVGALSGLPDEGVYQLNM